MSCDTESLEESYNINNNDLLIAVAAHLGGVRLIDNLVISKL
jgi:pantothenate synthetase